MNRVADLAPDGSFDSREADSHLILGGGLRKGKSQSPQLIGIAKIDDAGEPGSSPPPRRADITLRSRSSLPIPGVGIIAPSAMSHVETGKQADRTWLAGQRRLLIRQERESGMKRLRLVTRAAVGLALVGMLLPQCAVLAQAPRPLVQQPSGVNAGQPAPTQAVADIGDVALAAGGVFTGQVVDAQGIPQAGVPLVIGQQQRFVATATTDAQGRFSIHGLQGGIYQVTAGENMKNLRLWAADTAPPSAQKSAMLVSGSQVVRGQGIARRILTNPWVLAVGVAAAIAIPIALSNRSKESTS